MKIAVRIKETASRIKLAFAANCPDAALFRGLLGALTLAQRERWGSAPVKSRLINLQRLTDTV